MTALGPAVHVFERNLLSHRRIWLVFISGLIEPIFYLLGLGVALGSLIGEVSFDGVPVSYASFVAPGLVASSAMNGAVADATYNFFYKLKYAKTFDTMLATPLTLGQVVVGEVAWSMARGGIYSTIFLAVAGALGLIQSWWALLMIPVALLVGLAFSAVGTAVTSLFRSWHDFDYIQLAVQPMMLASTTFFALSVYPAWARPLVQATPLYHGVALCRQLAFGAPSLSDIGHVGYLLTMTAVGFYFTRKRLSNLLLG